MLATRQRKKSADTGVGAGGTRGLATGIGRSEQGKGRTLQLALAERSKCLRLQNLDYAVKATEITKPSATDDFVQARLSAFPIGR